MSTVLLTLAAEGPQWPQILGVLVAVWLVFWWAVWARRPAAVPGRHRPDQVGVPDVFDRVMAAAAPVEAAAAFRAAHRVVAEQLAAEVRVPAHLLAVDDWTADLPTAQLRVVTDSDLAGVYDSTVFAASGFPTGGFVPGGLVVAPDARHTSPSRAAAEDWPPIFDRLAKECGYDPDRGFDGWLVAA